MDSIRRVAANPRGPLLLALGLAVLSIPFAAISINAVSEFPTPYPEQYVLPVGWATALPMAVVSVVLAAVVAGTIAGFTVRRRPVGGMLLALFLAWPVAIVALPLFPALVGVSYQGVWFCFDSCQPMVTSTVWSAAQSYVLGVWLGIVGPVEITLILLGLGYWARRRGHRSTSIVLGVAAWVSLNAWVILIPLKSPPGVLPAALALIVGCVLWARPYFAPGEEPVTSVEPAPAVS